MKPCSNLRLWNLLLALAAFVMSSIPALCQRAASQDTQSRPTVPKPFVFMDGWSDNLGSKGLHYWNNQAYRAAWQQLLPYLTAVVGTTANPNVVLQFKSQGKLFAYDVHAPEDIPASKITAKDLCRAWAEPFQNSLGGRLPGGFDAVSIDEFGFPDGTPRSKADVEALRALRAAYPNKLIFVYGALPIGDGGPNSHFGNKRVAYNDELNAINKFADLFFMEVYQYPKSPKKFALFQSIPQNLNSVSPGLAAKTIFALDIDDVYLAHDPEEPKGVDSLKFREKQIPLVRAQIAQQRIGDGVGFWVMYRAKPQTITGIENILKSGWD